MVNAHDIRQGQLIGANEYGSSIPSVFGIGFKQRGLAYTKLCDLFAVPPLGFNNSLSRSRIREVLSIKRKKGDDVEAVIYYRN